MRRAYSYIRFSTTEQSKGDSLRRQIALSKDYAARNGLILDETLRMQDIGVSAFNGANLEPGAALGHFLEAVKSNKVDRGSFLLVESLDRLSRDRTLIALSSLIQLIQAGISVVTLSDNKVYDENVDSQDLMMSIVIMSRANNESLEKSRRIAHAWANKHNNAETRTVTKWVPGWLTVDETGKIVTIKEREKLIKQIYAWALDGYGTRLILQKIEDLKIAPWGATTAVRLSSNTERTRLPSRWHLSYINRLLCNRAVLGEYEPNSVRSGTRLIENYFPRIIDDATFYKVQEARKRRDVRSNGSAGPKGKNVANLFSGLLKCGYSLERDGIYKCAGDSTSMVFVNKGPRSVTKYLQCTRLKEGNRGCEACNKLWRYGDFESAFLSHLKDVDYAAVFGSDKENADRLANIRDELATLKGATDNNRDIIKRFVKAVADSAAMPESFLQEVRNREEAIAKNEGRIKELQARLRASELDEKQGGQAKKKLKSILTLLKTLPSSKVFETRLNLSEIIRQSISSIELYVRGDLSIESYRSGQRPIDPSLLKILESNDAQLTKGLGYKPQQFFIVNYRSGECRLVIPSPENPEKLAVSLKWEGPRMLSLEAPKESFWNGASPTKESKLKSKKS